MRVVVKGERWCKRAMLVYTGASKVALATIDRHLWGVGEDSRRICRYLIRMPAASRLTFLAGKDNKEMAQSDAS